MISFQRILIGAGALLVLAAVSLLGYSLVEDYLAGARARDLLDEVMLLTADDPGAQALGGAGGPSVPRFAEPGANAMAYDDTRSRGVIGVLDVPRFGIHLPVLGEFTQEQMDVTVCRYSGVLGLPPDRLVLAGHNFRSHLKSVPELVLGDEVTFTLLSGEVYRYQVSELDAVTGADRVGIAMGDWDLTLLTCNRDLTLRVLVRCKLAATAVTPATEA